MSEPIPTTNRPCCPRCGYDQSGVVAAWTERCPIRGVCSECGLDFEWEALLVPGRHVIGGFVEHERGRRGIVAAVRTAWWSVWPARLWRRVPIETPLDLRRAVINYAALLVLMYAALVVKELAVTVVFVLSVPPPAPGMPRAVPIAEALTVLTGGLMPFEFRFMANGPSATAASAWVVYSPRLLAVAGSWTAVMPLASIASVVVVSVTLLGLPDTRGRAKIRSALVARGAVHTTLPVLVAIVASAAYSSVSSLWSIASIGSTASSSAWTYSDVLGAMVVYLDRWPGWGRLGTWVSPTIIGTLLVGSMLWQAFYWAAVVRSWRLPNARAVTVVVSIVLVLTYAIATVLA